MNILTNIVAQLLIYLQYTFHTVTYSAHVHENKLKSCSITPESYLVQHCMYRLMFQCLEASLRSHDEYNMYDVCQGIYYTIFSYVTICLVSEAFLLYQLRICLLVMATLLLHSMRSRNRNFITIFNGVNHSLLKTSMVSNL